MDIRAQMLVFFQGFERSDRSFGPGYPRECPRDVRPKKFLFGLLFRS